MVRANVEVLRNSKVSGKSRLILKEGLRIPASSSRHEGAEGGGARSRRALRNQAAVAAGARAMGKHYFCDYCNRSFQDNLHNRKKHLNGLQHLKAKKVWYDMFRDAAAILLDEQNKRPCRKFLLTGQCDFGSNCRFSHMSERDLQELSIQVEEERRAREWPLDVVELPEGHLEDWLEKRAKRLSSAPSSRLPAFPGNHLSSAPVYLSIHLRRTQSQNGLLRAEQAWPALSKSLLEGR
uniref:Zinc finger matrin-type protein 5 n=1 Tax=Ursus maritimus TaxID=29073 RepID=A0A452UPW8_URSMA